MCYQGPEDEYHVVCSLYNSTQVTNVYFLATPYGEYCNKEEKHCDEKLLICTLGFLFTKAFNQYNKFHNIWIFIL